MIPAEEARSIIAGCVHALPPERVPIEFAYGRVLRETRAAQEDMPAFDRSAMDGYAIRRDDPSQRFRIVETIPAGARAGRGIGAGECARIFTGAAIPAGADHVVMQELAAVADGVVTFSSRGDSSNIRRRGEDAREGSVLLDRGTRLGAVEIALCAQVGAPEPLVAQRPRVFHVVSGSELVAPGVLPGEGQIRDSNSVLTAALASEAGCDVIAQRRTGDDFDALLGVLHSVPDSGWDLLLLSGGAGPGEHDLGLRVLDAMGFSVRFQQLNLRPGKPLIFATRGRKAAFVIPGNPLAHVVCWHIVIRTALDMLLTGATEFALVPGTLAGAAGLPGNARETWWPARIRWEGGAPGFEPLRWQSSGDLTGVAGLDAFIRVPSRSPGIEPGAPVMARLLR